MRTPPPRREFSEIQLAAVNAVHTSAQLLTHHFHPQKPTIVPFTTIQKVARQAAAPVVKQLKITPGDAHQNAGHAIEALLIVEMVGMIRRARENALLSLSPSQMTPADPLEQLHERPPKNIPEVSRLSAFRATSPRPGTSM